MLMWREIWRKRQLDTDEQSLLSQLTKANGYHDLGSVDEQAWSDYIDRFASRLHLDKNDSIFEVGCGAGALLYPFYRQGYRVGGIDYAENLVHIARNAMTEAKISVVEAVDLAITPPYSVIVSQGVFLYFPDYDYAAETLFKMIQKAEKSVAILDVPDLAKRDDALKLRRGCFGEKEYDEKYKGLDHLYYSKDWFIQALSGTGIDIQIEDQNISGYMHNAYRFNVFLTKSAVTKHSAP